MDYFTFDTIQGRWHSLLFALVFIVLIVCLLWWYLRPPETPLERYKHEREINEALDLRQGKRPTFTSVPLNDVDPVKTVTVNTVSEAFKLDKNGRKYDPKTGRKLPK